MAKKKKLVVFTGSGVSAESGIPTFRATDGLWENYRIEDVATPEAWKRNPEHVLSFYKERFLKIIEAQPNDFHAKIAELQDSFEVVVITQNIDDLHERAGSKNVIHLHGEITKARSTGNPDFICNVPKEYFSLEDRCPEGFALRPHIIWFNEAVPMMDAAIYEVQLAEVFVVAGTSLQVYPAASLVNYVSKRIPSFVVDPENLSSLTPPHFQILQSKAAEGASELYHKLQEVI